MCSKVFIRGVRVPVDHHAAEPAVARRDPALVRAAAQAAQVVRLRVPERRQE